MNKTATTILIIDDDSAVRNSIAFFLDDLDYTTIQAKNGRIGLGKFNQNKIDLILVDLNMPELNGIEVITQVNKISPLTPIIVISGVGEISSAVEALNKGAWDYLLKPIKDFSLLTHSVTSALEKAHLKMENTDYQKNLEQIVLKRTEELKCANLNLEQINSRLNHIVSSTQTLSFCTDVKIFGHLLLEEFANHMDATGGSLYLKEQNGMQLIHSLDPGHASDFINLPFADGSVFHQAVKHKQPILIQSIKLDSNIASSGWNGYKDGSSIVFPLPDKEGEIMGILTLHSKITPPFIDQDKEIGQILTAYSCEALRAVHSAEKIKKSLKEKEVLLQEVNHRVKNNLNVIISLLNLKADSISSGKDAVEAFEESRDLVFSMAMVHEELYQSKNLTKINIKNYTESLALRIIEIYQPFVKIKYKQQIDDINIYITKAIPCGMILTELITNALKHAFNDTDDNNTLEISWFKLDGDDFNIIVKDNGKGLPNNIDMQNPVSSGLQLVNILTSQIEGQISVNTKNGTEFIISFPE